MTAGQRLAPSSLQMPHGPVPDHREALHATSTELLLTMLGGVWITLGLFLDGYAHQNVLTETNESFFTPWHAIFYSGFAATAACCGLIVVRRSRTSASIGEATPVGYAMTLAGLCIFAAGGLGDVTWHTLRGVEAGIDALLSPTHIVMFIGLLLILTTPLRSFERDPERPLAPTLAEFALPLGSLVSAVSLVAFFFAYVWGIAEHEPAGVPYDPRTEAGQLSVQAGVGGAMVATVVMLGAALYVCQRWRPPVGTFAVNFTAVNLLVVLGFSQSSVALLAAGLGGLCLDLGLRHRAGAPAWPKTVRRSFAGAGFVMWATFFAALAVQRQLEWQPEIWGGVVLFAGFAGYALGVLGFPEPRPASVEQSEGRVGSRDRAPTRTSDGRSIARSTSVHTPPDGAHPSDITSGRTHA